MLSNWHLVAIFISCGFAAFCLLYIPTVLLVNHNNKLVWTPNYPTKSDVRFAKNEILKILNENLGGPFGDERILIAGFVRVSFHDCIGRGNCDGCINHSLMQGLGIDKITDKLDQAFSIGYTSKRMSRADFYMLAAYTALEEATAHKPENERFQGSMKYGRKDCPTSPEEDQRDEFLPLAFSDLQKITSFFKDEFGFNASESVAILGAHSLGRCHLGNSGFEGRWIRGKNGNISQADILDNEYYKAMKGNWTQVRLSNGLYQWQRPGTPPNDQFYGPDLKRNMFLNADLALVWDLKTNGDVNQTNGFVNCTVLVDSQNNCQHKSCCARSATNRATNAGNIFERFANSNVEWLRAFTEAFEKMTHVIKKNNGRVEINDNLKFPRP